MISEETRGQYPGNAPALMFFAAGAAFANRPPFTVMLLPHFELARPDHKQSNATQHAIARREKCHPPVGRGDDLQRFHLVQLVVVHRQNLQRGEGFGLGLDADCRNLAIPTQERLLIYKIGGIVRGGIGT